MAVVVPLLAPAVHARNKNWNLLVLALSTKKAAKPQAQAWQVCGVAVRKQINENQHHLSRSNPRSIWSTFPGKTAQNM